MTWADALTLFERLRARFFIPYHWGTFHHLTAGPWDAITRLRARLTRGPGGEEGTEAFDLSVGRWRVAARLGDVRTGSVGAHGSARGSSAGRWR